MTARGGSSSHVAGNGSDPQVVSLSITRTDGAERPIDDALDGLVTTLDDLARDLAFDDLDAPRGAPRAAGPGVRYRTAVAPAHGNAYTAGVMAVLIAFELMVLWMLLHG